MRESEVQHSNCLVDQAADVEKKDDKQKGPEQLQVQWLLASVKRTLAASN